MHGKLKAAILLLTLTITASALAQQQYPVAGTKQVWKNGAMQTVKTYRLFNGEIQTSEQIAEAQKLINDIVANVGKEAFMKFSNGSIAYVGKMLSIRYGLLPPVPSPTETIHTNTVILIDYGYEVHDVTPNGCRITCEANPWQPDYKDLFVVGLTGYSDRQYKNILMLRLLGDYTYNTVNGGSRTIPKFEVGTPCTRDEYLAYMKKL
jgi:hypothetical protein